MIPDDINQNKGLGCPNGLFLEITNRCNLHCIHCYNYKLLATNTKNEEFNDVLTTEAIRDIIHEFHALGGRYVLITGGEPLERSDCLDILEYCMSIGIKTSLLTNGTLIDGNIAKELNRIGCDLQISLDGASPEVNDRIRGYKSFRRTLNGIHNILATDANKRITLAMTPTKMNLNDIGGVIDLAVDLQIDKIRFSFLHKQGRAISKWSNINLLYKDWLFFIRVVQKRSRRYSGKINIKGAFSSLSRLRLNLGCSLNEMIKVNWQGFVQPCPLFDDDDHCLGDLARSSLRKIIYGEKRINMVKTFKLRLSRMPQCTNCEWKYFCGAGCPARTFFEYGTIWKPDPLCQIRKTIYRELIDDSH